MSIKNRLITGFSLMILLILAGAIAGHQLDGNSLILFYCLELIVTVLIAVMTIRSITSPINTILKLVNEFSRGNLDNDAMLNSHSGIAGEIGQVFTSLRHLQNKLTDVIDGIRIGADEVTNAASQVSAGNTNLSQRTQEQASSLEEIASSMEQMTGTVNQNAENAQLANQLVTEAHKQANEGGEVADKAVSAMGEINNSSEKISEIIGVIDEIAFQTNLLALNAAVEAARAGEQGRGFAVVASEVRNLAQRSAKAAKEIKNLIEDSVNKVEIGTRLVDESGKALDEIVNSVKKVSDIVADIATASKEQSSGIEQVNRAIVQMDEMTQQNASLVEEAAAASESMGSQAEDLMGLVKFFKLTGEKQKMVKRPTIQAIKKVAEVPEVVKQKPLPKVPLPKALPEEDHDDSDWKEF